MNKKVILVITILALSLFLLPRFYFNHLEFKNRELLTEIETTRDTLNSNIEERSGRSGGIKDVNEHYNLTIDIESNTNKIDFLVNEHENILEKQGSILFLLPLKYKEYYKIKNEAFKNYYQALRKFKLLKDYESGIYKILATRDKINQSMQDVGKSVITLNDASKYFTDYENSKPQLLEYLNNKFINQELYDALVLDINSNSKLIKLLLDLKDEKITGEEFTSEFNQIDISVGYKNMIGLYTNSYDRELKLKQDEWFGFIDLYNEQSANVLKYYDDNRLAYDPLSIIISKFNKLYPRNIGLSNYGKNAEVIKADLNGDGEKELLSLTNSGSDEEPAGLLTAYDESGKEIAKLFEGNPIPMPFSNSAKIYTLDKDSKKEFVSYEFIAGPHSSRTTFFGMYKLSTGQNSIVSICKTKGIKESSDCMFWSGEVGSLLVNDFDKDGKIEVVEMVDEYPKDGVLTKEEEDAIIKVFGSDDKETLEGVTRIPKREKGGRGNRVVWGIYSFNGEIFEQQLGTNYEKYYKFVKEYLDLNLDYPTVMKRGELSKSSLEYNEFMKDFWTKDSN